MNLNDCIVRGTPSRSLYNQGFRAQVIASVGGNWSDTYMLLMQGRPTALKAIWSQFHTKKLAKFPRLKGKVYVSPNPTATLPSGEERLIIHQAFFPQTYNPAEDYWMTFGPGHFGWMFPHVMPMPFRLAWEEEVWRAGIERGLIVPEPKCFACRAWKVSLATTPWLAAYKDRRVGNGTS